MTVTKSLHSTTPAPRFFSAATVRRLYFYGITLVSLIVGLAAVDGLIRVLSELWLTGGDGLTTVGGTYLRQTIARSAGTLVVATPVFLLHWRYIQKRHTVAEEKGATLRKLFLYIASAVALGYSLVNAYNFVQGAAYLAFGGPLANSDFWPAAWLHYLAVFGIAQGLQSYLHHVLVADGDYGAESGWTVQVRRLYQALVGLAGLLMVIFGSSTLLNVLWDGVFSLLTGNTSSSFWGTQLADGAALLLVGAVLTRVNWQRWQAVVIQSAREGAAALRRLALYLSVVISALTALIPAAALLNEVLLILLGNGAGPLADLLDQLVTPLSFVPVGVASWIWHQRVVQAEMARYGESDEAATVRRLYVYLVAATALGVFWFGASTLLQVVVDLLLTGDTFWTEPLANGLSLVIVGAPIWAVHWRAGQTVARRTDADGAAERRSGPRKAYLYGAALAGSLLILFFLASVIYRLFLVVLGDPLDELLSAETAQDVARSLVSALFLALHVAAIRRDGQLGYGEEEAEQAPAQDVRAELEGRIRQLERELASARAALAAFEE